MAQQSSHNKPEYDSWRWVLAYVVLAGVIGYGLYLGHRIAGQKMLTAPSYSVESR